MRALVTLYTLLSTLLCCPTGFCQSVKDTTELTTTLLSVQQRYAVAFPSASQLYNGPEYIDYALRYSARVGHQFFMWPDRKPGSIIYNEQYYSNILLAYDIVLDQVVLPFPNSPFTLRLVNDNVREFTINGHRFLRITADSTVQSILTTGYYEVLAAGTVQVLAKRSKNLQKQIRQGKIEANFTANTKLFLEKNGIYYNASSRKKIQHAFGENEKQIPAYCQSKKLKFNKKNIESSLIDLAIYYNKLTTNL